MADGQRRDCTDLRRERKYRMRRLLVVGQVATSVVVLATSGLFVRNLFAAMP